MKNVTLYYSPTCIRSTSILGNCRIEKGKERQVAEDCLNTISSVGWKTKDVMAVALFDGDKEVCRRFIGGFEEVLGDEMTSEEAVAYLAEMFTEMLAVEGVKK